MKLLIQIFIGYVIGVIALRTLSEWFRAAESSTTTYDRSRHGGLGQYLDVDKLTRDDIESGVAVHEELAEFVRSPDNSHGELRTNKVVMCCSSNVYNIANLSNVN